MMKKVLEATTLYQENMLGLWPGGDCWVHNMFYINWVIINIVKKYFYANKLNGNNLLDRLDRR
jgi:hypothetical protein